MEKKNKIILLIITFTLILIFSGITYAYFSSFTPSENGSTIYAKGGTMKISYANGSGNIVMENIYPKEEAWVNKVFTVTGNNTTELDMEYRLYLVTTNNQFNLDDLTYSISGTSTNIGDKLVEKANQPLAKFGELLIGSGIFKNKTATHSYNLRIFYKETNKDQNSGQGKSFAGYVTIDNGSNFEKDSIVASQSDGYIGAEYNSTTPAFNGPVMREQVEKITFNSSNNVPNNAIISWDASAKQNGSVMAYVLDEDYNGLYELYIGQDNKVTVGLSAKRLFAYYTKLKTLDISNIDTSNTITMEGMFKGNFVTSMDLSSLNTSKVINMREMFSGTNVSSLDLSNFDTSNVTNMLGMFFKSKMATLNLSNFNTSKVNNMSGMFQNSVATSIDVSSFDTSNVTDMSNMFNSAQVKTLDLSNFDTSKVTNMNNIVGWSNITIGYARTQADADRLNASSNKPAGLTFTVKN